MKILQFCLLFCALVFGACSLKTSGLDTTQNVSLRSDEKAFQTQLKHFDKSLKILSPNTTMLLNSRQIIYVENGFSKAYAYHFWEDLPSEICALFFLNKLEQSQIFKSLASQDSVVKTDYILETRLDDFTQNLDQKENFVSIVLSANFIDTQKNKILFHKKFIIKENIESNDMLSLQKAFEVALNSLGNSLVLWLNSLNL